MRLMCAPCFPVYLIDQESRLGELLQIYQAAVGPVPPAVPLLSPTEKPLGYQHWSWEGSPRRHSPICALKQASASKIEEELAGKAYCVHGRLQKKHQKFQGEGAGQSPHLGLSPLRTPVNPASAHAMSTNREASSKFSASRYDLDKPSWRGSC
ncbi:hypothetical protein MRX96_033857 [Rhipicephalus microplus]